MPKGAKNLLLLAFIPFLAAVGHDVYINYFETPEKMKKVERLQFDTDDFLISDAGWLWHNYSPGTMKTAREYIPETTWTSYIDPILQLPTMVASLAFVAIALVFLLIAFVCGIWPFSHYRKMRRDKKEAEFTVYKTATTKKEYTRK